MGRPRTRPVKVEQKYGYFGVHGFLPVDKEGLVSIESTSRPADPIYQSPQKCMGRNLQITTIREFHNGHWREI